MQFEGTSASATLRLDTSVSSFPDKPRLRTSPKAHHHLSLLRDQRKVTDVTITPELAARTVREFLLPLFDEESHQQSARVRKEGFGLNGPSVYTELKLSAQLGEQLNEMQQVLRDKEMRLREAQQARQSALSQCEVLQLQLAKIKTDFTLLCQSGNSAIAAAQQEALRSVQALSQLAQYTVLYQQAEAEKKQLAAALHEEKAISDKLRNRATELESSNSLLLMENNIIGERLKGLYEAVKDTADTHILQEKLQPEISTIAEAVKQFAELQAGLKTSLAETTSDRDQIRQDFACLASLHKDTQESRDKLAISARDKIISLQEHLEKARDQIETLKIELDKCDKVAKSMEDEMSKMRAKIKQNRLKRRQYGEADEKICRKCQRVFVESENFNWSCRTHKGEYSDEMWWCCGKTTKDAPGCLVSKHESKDEEEEEDGKLKEETERQKVATMQCPVTHM